MERLLDRIPRLKFWFCYLSSPGIYLATLGHLLKLITFRFLSYEMGVISLAAQL